jgi:hypothetical protein
LPSAAVIRQFRTTAFSSSSLSSNTCRPAAERDVVCDRRTIKTGSQETKAKEFDSMIVAT